ncbi:hypothetical protein [Burkholderia sp. RS02]|uniref:hypothetical protein n=1 Tax=unclassified Burkholderia TaxID=2613784 RepID=UPI0032183B23
MSDSTTPSVVADASGIPHLAVTVASEWQRDRLLSTLKTRFGDGRLVADFTVVRGARTDWFDHVDTLLVCGAELVLRGLLIELAGLRKRRMAYSFATSFWEAVTDHDVR